MEVIDPLLPPNGRVVFGAKVKVYDPEANEESQFQIVGQSEGDASCGRISLSSPIGQALIGRQEGDEVRIKTPGGLRVLEIVEIMPAD
ncbi:transcription elongation factor GreA (fragment) [Desulfarculales bacterium]